MISRDTNIRRALRARQRGFLLNPFRFGGGGGGGGGAPTFQTVATTATTGAATSLALNMPAGISAGDVLIAACFADGSFTMSGSAGWTALSATTAFAGAGATSRVFWKVAAGGDAFTLSLTSSAQMLGVVWRYSSASEVYFAHATGGSTPVTPPTVTPAPGLDDYAFVLAVGFASNVANPSGGAPSGYTNAGNAATSGGLAGLNVRHFGAYKPLSNVSSETPGTIAYANATQWACYTLAVR